MQDNETYDENALFGDMVESAFEFLNKSLDEFESSLKFSILHFAVAIELILKARLMKEHWSLVVDRLDKAKRHDFFSGKSKTINPDTAIARLKDIACDPVSEDACKTFKEISQHRNRVVHFVHGVSDDSDETESEIEKVAAEQCLGWFYLHNLLSSAWNDHFKGFEREIYQLEFRMQRHRQYLDEKFKQIKPEIDKHQERGGSVRTCNSCKFDSVLVKEVEGALSSASCILCWYSGSVVTVECPHERCFQVIEFDSYTGPPEYCPSCRSPIESCIADVLDTGEPVTYDNYFDHVEINCPYCSGHHSVVEHHNVYVCTKCFEYSEDVGYCEWCSEGQLGGVSEFSAYSGCEFCDGRSE